MFPALDWFRVGANYATHLDLLMAFQPRRVLGFLLVVFLGSDGTFLSLYDLLTPDLYSRLADESPRQTYTPPATHRRIKVHHAFHSSAPRAEPSLFITTLHPQPHLDTALGIAGPNSTISTLSPPTPNSPAKPDKNPTYRIIGSNLGTFHGSSCSRDDPYPKTVRC